jgi:hypothetical protein
MLIWVARETAVVCFSHTSVQWQMNESRGCRAISFVSDCRYLRRALNQRNNLHNYIKLRKLKAVTIFWPDKAKKWTITALISL